MTATTPDPDEVYNTLFGPKTPEPLTPERQEVWDALFKEKPLAPLTPEQQEVWDRINGIEATEAPETADPEEAVQSLAAEQQQREWDRESTYSDLQHLFD